jgi:hypothetical protein
MGCLNCPTAEQKLPLNTKLYQGFGGYAVYKDGVYFWSADNDLEWDKNPTVRKVENMVKIDEKAEWEIRLDLPLRSAVWKRESKNNWVLIKTGEGFA